MKRSRLQVGVGAFLLMSLALLAQDSSPTVPALRDGLNRVQVQESGSCTPILQDALNRARGGEEVLWFRLDEDAAPSSVPRTLQYEAPSFREKWLMKTLAERFKGVSGSEILARFTVRHDGTTRTVASERGLEVRGSTEALARVRDFVNRFTAGSRKAVTLEVRVLDVEGELRGSDPGATAVVTTRQEFERRASRLAALGVDSVYRSEIKVFANQAAKISVVEQTAYLQDFEVAMVQDRKIVDPVVGVVADGFEMEITPLLDPDGGVLVVSGNIGLSKLLRPIREQRLKIADAEVTVQLPEVVSHRWKGEVKLEPGADTFVISGLKHAAPSGGFRMVEVWCLVKVEDPSQALVTGEIVDRDPKHGNIFVSFPREAVPDDPWSKAPKVVSVLRRYETIGKAVLVGGWVLGKTDPKHSVIAIYRLEEGTPPDGDTVR